MSPPRPPRLAEWLLAAILPPGDRAHALGDLHEEYRGVRERRGRLAADRWYWAQLPGALVPSLRRRLGSPGAALPELGRETRLALRALRRRPGLAAVAVGTLGLGIGAATAIFSVADTVLFQPLPFKDGERLVTVWDTYDSWRGHEVLGVYWDRIGLSWPEYLDWREHQTSFEDVAVYGTSSMAITGGGDPREVTVGFASASLFRLLGVELRARRSFAEDEVGFDALPLAILSYELWRDRYGADPALAGRSVRPDDLPFQVVGILPQDFRLRSLGRFSSLRYTRHALWLPVGAYESSLDRGNHSYEALGRLRPGVPLEQAGAEAAAIIWADAAPGTRGVRAVLRKDEEIGDSARPLLLLLAAVGLLLLIACGNVATLVLGDALGRRRELATKAALGAGTGRILRQLAVENVLLGLAGAGLGVLLAGWGIQGLLALAPAELALPATIAVDVRVLAFAGVLGLAAGLAVGILPGLLAGRRDLQRALNRRSSASEGARRSQRALVAAQVAVSLVLLTCSALLLRSFAELRSVDVGFDARDVVTARVSLPEARYESPEGALFFHDVVGRLDAMPGAVGATAVSAVPFSGRGGSSSFDLVGREPPPDAPDPEAHRRTVLPSYHEVMGIPLLEGRYLEPSDRLEEAPVIVVNESMARRYWPDGSALGSRIFRDRREWEIVGVVADVLHADLKSEALPTFYLPLDVAEARSDMTLVVRSGLPADQVAAQIRDTVWAVDPTLPVEDVAAVSALVARSATDERFRTLLLSAFALMATVLCAVGLFGVVARAVAARTSELGVRVALGARGSTLVSHVVARELPALAAGIALGVAGALAVGHLLSAFLFGISPRDPASLAGAVAVLATTGLLAILGAARRALSLDPVEAIRTE